VIGLSGLTYVWQGWSAGSEGFSQAHTIAILPAMIGLGVVASRMQRRAAASGR